MSALALTSMLLLSGCATTQPAPSAAATSHAPAAPIARGAAPVPPATTRVVRSRSLPVALSDESSLRALDPTGVKQLIGPPTFVRQDGGATVWQYSGRGCVVDLFWYNTDAGLALLHAEARNIHSPRAAEMKACLDDLWKTRGAEAES